MTTHLSQLDRWLTSALVEPDTKRYIADDPLQNGLQVHGRSQVRRVGFAVSASMAVFQQAKQHGCDVIVAHHGLMLPAKQLDSITAGRLAYVMKHDVSLWSAHFLLDAHSSLGNNVRLLQAAGAVPTERYVDSSGVPWGWVGELEKPLSFSLVQKRLRSKLSSRTLAYPFGSKTVRRIVAVSGRGAPEAADFTWLQQQNIDLYITGEFSEWHQEQFREGRLNGLAGGHYHTEVFGLQSLQRQMTKEIGVKTVWLSQPNSV